jgi:hypothetical protein
MGMRSTERAAAMATWAGGAANARPVWPSSLITTPGHTRSPGRRLSASPPAKPSDHAPRMENLREALSSARRARSHPMPAWIRRMGSRESRPATPCPSSVRHPWTAVRHRRSARRSCARATISAIGGGSIVGLPGPNYHSASGNPLACSENPGQEPRWDGEHALLAQAASLGHHLRGPGCRRRVTENSRGRVSAERQRRYKARAQSGKNFEYPW